MKSFVFSVIVVHLGIVGNVIRLLLRINVFMAIVLTSPQY